MQQTTKKSLTMIQGKQIMSLLCTAQTVWNNGLKKHESDSHLWLRMGSVLWVGDHVCDQVHII